MSGLKVMPLDPKLLEEAQAAWCPSWPRKVVDPRRKQFTVRTPEEARYALSKVNGRSSGFVSVYSFPRGHSKDGNIPQVDTIMYDLDVPVNKESYTEADWRRDASELMARVRLVARALVDNGKAEHWRASLSGFKGVHLYQDFPAIDPDNGTIVQFKRGIGEYADNVIEALEKESHTALADWVDVDSSDLGRLTRHPNTLHVGATEFFGQPRWCVPVSIEELTEIDHEEYARLTRKPRPLPEGCQRTENPKAGEILARYIRDATGGTGERSPLSGMTYAEREEAVTAYDKTANHNMESLNDVRFVLHHRPCIFEWRDRPDAFEHGEESHQFELFTIVNMVAKNVPVSLMKEFFEGMHGYDEQITNERIRDVVAWTKGEPLPCGYAADNAPTFCSGEH